MKTLVRTTLSWIAIHFLLPTRTSGLPLGVWGGNGYTDSGETLETLKTDYGFSIVSSSMKAGYAVNDFLPRMEAAGWKAILRFSAAQDDVIDGACTELSGSTGGRFSLDVWKDSIRDNLYFERQEEIQYFIDRGVLQGVMIADDVQNYGDFGWDECDPTLEEIGEMGTYIQDNFPGLQVWIRMSPELLLERADGASDRASTLSSIDVAVAQFTAARYEIESYTTGNVNAANDLELHLGCGLNIADGGDGSSGQEGWKGSGFYTMTADEVQSYGSYMISNSCCDYMLLWEFDGNEVWPDGTIGADYFEADADYKTSALALQGTESTASCVSTSPSNGPTNAPTPPATTPPSTSPTNAPTNAPTPPATPTPSNCGDDSSFKFTLDNVAVERGCHWINKNNKKASARKARYCPKSEISNACPATCSSACQNDSSFTFRLIWNNKEVDCTWITKNMLQIDSRQETYCGTYGTSCVSACGRCSA